MQFKDVIGHQATKERLINSVDNNRISHAQLFVGKEGSGALAMAIAYAQYIACTHRTAGDSCGVCSSCIKFNKLIHPDLHFAYPINTTDDVKKDPLSVNFLPQWRTALLQNPYLSLYDWLEKLGIENKQGIINADESNEIVHKMSLTPYESEYKFMIIWMAEKLNTTSANKLLKIIEEPPNKTVFILIAEQQEQLLATIISRTQLVKINRITKPEMMTYLIEHHELEGHIADSIANIADGNYNEAYKLLKYAGTENTNFILLREWMRLCYSREFVELNKWVEEKMKKFGRENQKNFLQYALHIFRECIVKQYAGEELNKLNDEEHAFVNKFSPFINGANIEVIMEEFNKAYYHIERNANPSILFMDLSLKLFGLLRLK